MKNLITLAAMALIATGCSSTQFARTMETASGVLGEGGSAGLTNEEVIAGLKQALTKGAEHSVDVASATDGFWKDARLRIPFPEEAIKVRNTLLDIGMSAQVEQFERTMNHAAENAAKEAVPIFVNAIKGMTVADGFAILKGDEHAATDFLKERTTQELTGKFRPIVERATQEVALTSYWQPLTSAYNTATLFTGGQTVDPDLDAYVTQRAIDGLFVLVAEQEQRIREDPLARTTDLLRRVFGAQ